MRSFVLLFFLVAFFGHSLAAQWPQSNVYVFNVQLSAGEYKLTNPRFLTADNASGYNNQPHFHNNLLYISAAAAESANTNIWELDVIRGVRSRFTETTVSEFSPKMSADGNAVHCIVIEEDGKTQRLWQYPANRRGAAQRALTEPLDAGYYEWLGSNRIIIFRANENLSTEIAETNPRYRVIHEFDTPVGRCFKYLGNNRLAMTMQMQGEWYLGVFSLNTMQWEPLIEMPGSGQDFAVSSGGVYWTGHGSVLYKFDPHRDNSWVEVADLVVYNISNITRLDISVSGLLAIVDQP